MKNPKKLTYNERLIVASWGLDPDKWRREKVVDGCLLLRHAETNEPRKIPAMIKSK